MYEIIEREITVIVDIFILKSLNFQDPSIIRQQVVMKNCCDMNQGKPYHNSLEMFQKRLL